MEKGEQSNREYSSKVLASKDLHYICIGINEMAVSVDWTGECQKRRGKPSLSKTSIFKQLQASCSIRRDKSSIK